MTVNDKINQILEMKNLISNFNSSFETILFEFWQILNFEKRHSRHQRMHLLASFLRSGHLLKYGHWITVLWLFEVIFVSLVLSLDLTSHVYERPKSSYYS